MSGFEVIGTVGDMFKYLDTFDMIYVEFSTTLSRFLQECEHLYRKELELPDHRYKEFMKDGGKQWEERSRVDFEQKLRGKLGHDLQAYMDLSRYLEKRLAILKKKLGLSEDFSVRPKGFTLGKHV
ncbi:hypothetical protein UCDDS831_g08231 [Diplodia seriata]|uniref:Uncharacterized protein n=1 Tax=Diplodia seriata TaxID=420778 RepID=A0A0G2DWP3_9PEZI|nr:hypothetical protein UCDDS831_g08231 [Diplodia seriata]